MHQVAVKQCYLATVSTRATIREVQLVDEERKVFEDVGRTLEAKVVKDVVRYDLVRQAQTISSSLIQT